jgi:hypothetical protein
MDLIVSVFERENGYRHPPLYIVKGSFRIIIHSEAREEQRTCEEDPCTD